MSKRLLTSSLLIISILNLTYGQGGDYYDNSGKIYTVVAVVAVTLLGIVAFLIYLERKIKIIENKINDEYRNH